MGLFFNRTKRVSEGGYPPPNPNDRVDLPAPEREHAIMETAVEEPTLVDYQSLADEGNAIRRQRLAEIGVDVGMFTKKKVLNDAIAVLDEYAPSYTLLKTNLSRAHVAGEFSNLTKTGKAPKNVYVGHVTAESTLMRGNSFESDSVIIEIKYLKDGSINMADLHLWHAHVRHGMSIRTVDGDRRVTCITKTDMHRNLEDTLYLNNKPGPGSEAVEIFDNAMRALVAS